MARVQRVSRRQWWTVGRLHDPQPEEKLKTYDDLDAAMVKAGSWAGCDHRDTIAVWDQNEDVVAVFTAGLKLVSR
jgi:hypothetical protein